MKKHIIYTSVIFFAIIFIAFCLCVSQEKIKQIVYFNQDHYEVITKFNSYYKIVECNAIELDSVIKTEKQIAILEKEKMEKYK